jgi:hypothetical protein
MKQMNYFALIMSIVLFYSCKKENPLDNNDDNQLIIQDMNQITAPKNF